MELEHRTIERSAVVFSDRSYFLAPAPEAPPDGLVASIRQFGILHPPLLLERADGMYTIVSGRKRAEAACENLGMPVIPALVIPQDSGEDVVLSLLLEEVLLSSPSPVEQISLLERLLQDHPPEAALPMLAKLGHKPNRHTLDGLLALKNLHPSALLALHRGRLSQANAARLLQLPSGDQQTLVTLITHLRLGGSKQRQLIACSIELYKRDSSEPAAVLAPFADTIGTGSPENMPQQAEALLKQLHTRCFPRSTAAREEFARRVARLSLPPAMDITHTPAFEDDALTLSIRFADWNSLENALDRIIAALADHPPAANEVCR